MIEYLFYIFSGVWTGMIASVSVTTKNNEKLPTEQNTNKLLSLSITLGFLSVMGILIGLCIAFLIDTELFFPTFIFFILTFLVYYFFLRKLIGKLRLSFFLDIILYSWSFITYVLLTQSLISELDLFNKANAFLYNSVLSILLLFVYLIYNFIKLRV
jgi:hypothetical protein